MSIKQQQQPTRQTHIFEYTALKGLIGIDNGEIKAGNQMLMRGRIISSDDVRFHSFIRHLQTIGVDVQDYGITANALSYAYSPEIPDYGLRGELVSVITPQGRSNTGNTTISFGGNDAAQDAKP